MKFCLIQGLEQNCLFICSAGKYDAVHVRSMIRAGSALDFYQRRVTILNDMRLVDFTMDRPAQEWLVSTLPDTPKHSNTAMVADTEVGFAMISLYAELRGCTPEAFGAFRAMNDALEWLAIPGARRAIPTKIKTIMDAAFNESDRQSTDFQLTINKVTTGQEQPKIVAQSAP